MKNQVSLSKIINVSQIEAMQARPEKTNSDDRLFTENNPRLLGYTVGIELNGLVVLGFNGHDGQGFTHAYTDLSKEEFNLIAENVASDPALAECVSSMTERYTIKEQKSSIRSTTYDSHREYVASGKIFRGTQVYVAFGGNEALAKLSKDFTQRLKDAHVHATNLENPGQLHGHFQTRGNPLLTMIPDGFADASSKARGYMV